MQDMLSKIVDMDEKARQLTEQAEQQKVDSQKEIIKTKEDIYNNFIARARKRIALNEQAERKAAEEIWLTTKEKQEKILQAMEDLYQEKGQEWVNTIVQNVIQS